MHAAPLRHRAPPHHPCVQGARALGHEVEAHGLAAAPSSIVSAAGDTTAMALARTGRLHGKPGSWRASIRGHAAAGWWRHRRPAGGGTGGRLVGLPDFFFYMFFKNVRRVSLSPTANSLSSARELAHGKEALCRPLVAVSVLPCVTHGKVFAMSEPAFAVCQRHTANGQSPVVKYFL